MVVRLSDGGKLEIGEGQSVVRLDRHGQVIEILRPGDSCYGYWLGLVRPEGGGYGGGDPMMNSPPLEGG
jgi:hypothetical protein